VIFERLIIGLRERNPDLNLKREYIPASLGLLRRITCADHAKFEGAVYS
jgi:hypothetical protein